VGENSCLRRIDPDTLNIDPKAIEASITPNTVAVIPGPIAGPGGHGCRLAVASLHDIAVIEDAAQAHARGLAA